MLYILIDKVQRWRHRNRLKNYIKSIPSLVCNMRRKDQIKVAFILHEAALWKTEVLYNDMMKHPRFLPSIYTTLSGEGQPSSISKKYIQLLNYLDSNGYEYTEARSMDDIDTDIVFYEKPYDESYLTNIQSRYCKSLIAYAPYGFNSFNIGGVYNLECILRSFQFYVENKDVAKVLETVMVNNGSNTVVTGTPMMDMLLKPGDRFKDPWKSQNKQKKRIIWAPHFSIQTGVSWLDLSSFMMMHEFMPVMAKKYEDSIQFAFKPHPLLFNKLVGLWGLRKTNEYYEQWNKMSNGQLETGEYVGLFKHSDAMIHDCGSFLVEYLYTDNPVMYTVRDKDKTVNFFNKFGRQAFNQMYHGGTIEEIEKFIQNVVAGDDPLKESRIEFKKKHLLPPNNQSACQNIIDAILGQNGYK